MGIDIVIAPFGRDIQRIGQQKMGLQEDYHHLQFLTRRLI